MAEDSTADSERVRQHVTKVLAQLRALKERQRAQENLDPGSDNAVEIDREKNSARSIGGGDGPS
jgi:hypothetical protein